MDINEQLEKAAEQLKEKVTAPEWVGYVKTSPHKEEAPINRDWWYIRLASILRKIAIKGPIGVSKLRTIYGGKKNRGHKPSKFVRGSGSIIRKAMQQLEHIGYIKQEQKGVHKGRVLTKEGQEFLKSLKSD